MSTCIVQLNSMLIATCSLCLRLKIWNGSWFHENSVALLVLVIYLDVLLPFLFFPIFFVVVAGAAAVVVCNAKIYKASRSNLTCVIQTKRVKKGMQN